MSAVFRPMHVFHDPPLDGPANMGRDEHLLHSEELRPAAVRTYRWSPPTISLGYFQRHTELAGLPQELRALAVVRRQTGGGAILHDREVTYCLVIDDNLPVACAGRTALYRLVHTCWRDTLARDEPRVELAPDSLPLPSPRGGPFFCFQQPGQTDLVVGPDKLLGSAQRRIPGRVLQHGSLLLHQRFAAHPGAHLHDPPMSVVERWIGTFVIHLARALDLTPQLAKWSPGQLADAARRRQRYADDAWTRLR